MPDQKIKNVFILMLENHSFDNLFGFSGIAGINGLTGNETNSFNSNPSNPIPTKYKVSNNAPDTMPSDPGHEFLDTLQQLCGHDNIAPTWALGDTYPPLGSTIGNLGFVANYATTVSEQTKVIKTSPPPTNDIGDVMLCFDTAKKLPAIYELATQFAICDNWFASMPGPTWPNRYFAYAASSGSLDDSPSISQEANWEATLGGGFSFPHGSVFSLLKKNNLNYRLYQDGYSKISFPIVQALAGIHWSDMNDISHFAKDLSNNYNYPLTLIEPNYGDIFLDTYRGGSSQHPMDGMLKGEALIKTVYEAIFNSPVWENSLLIITYDEHGGFYDHVAPPPAPKPNDNATGFSQHGFDFSNYGVRVPAVVVSPFIPANTVSKLLYDHSSMIKTVTENWGLPSLTNRDQQANSLSGLLTLSEPRQKSDCPSSLKTAIAPLIANAVSPAANAPFDELSQLDNLPLPKSGNIIGFLQIAAKTDHELSLTGKPTFGLQAAAEKANVLATVKTIQTRGDARRYINTVLDKLKLATARK